MLNPALTPAMGRRMNEARKETGRNRFGQHRAYWALSSITRPKGLCDATCLINKQERTPACTGSLTTRYVLPSRLLRCAMIAVNCLPDAFSMGMTLACISFQ